MFSGNESGEGASRGRKRGEHYSSGEFTSPLAGSKQGEHILRGETAGRAGTPSFLYLLLIMCVCHKQVEIGEEYSENLNPMKGTARDIRERSPTECTDTSTSKRHLIHTGYDTLARDKSTCKKGLQDNLQGHTCRLGCPRNRWRPPCVCLGVSSAHDGGSGTVLAPLPITV
eukprot:scaffold52552_cov17-Tisochrysis_lutea.AAC.2